MVIFHINLYVCQRVIWILGDSDVVLLGIPAMFCASQDVGHQTCRCSSNCSTLRILAAWLMSKCSFPQGFCHRTVIFIHIHPFSSIFLLDLAAGLFGFVHGVARRTAVSTQTLMWRRRDALTLFYRLPRMPAWAFYLARHIAVPPRSAGEPGECE